MHINIKNLFRLNPNYLALLLVAKQAGSKDLSVEIAQLLPDETELQELIESGYINIIKGKKGQELPERVRLGKSGTKYLTSLNEAEVLDEDTKIFEWLSEIYRKNGKEIGNGKRTQRLIASFREKSGIEKNRLAFLCNTFISDEDQMEWSHRLEFVFYKPTNMYNTQFVLEDSRLWKYYSKKIEYFEAKFKNIK